MILDTMDRIHLYEGVLPHAAEIARLFRQRTETAPVCAAFEIRDKRYDTKADEKRRFEVHAHTIDLMVGLEGEEYIHVCRPDELTPAESLPGGADGMKLDGGPRGSAIRLVPGFFAALYPGEAHMVGGQVIPGKAEPLHKWVVKLPLLP